MSSLADRVVAALGPAFGRAAGDLLAGLVDALTAPAVAADEAFSLTDDGWPALVDARVTPQPTWLAQLVGAAVNHGDGIEAQRAELLEHPGWQRGTLTALQAAIRPLLTRTQRVDVAERDGSPWRTKITVYEQELAPGVTEADVAAAAETQRPVGIIFAVIVATSASYEHMRTVHPMDYAAADSYWGTYDAFSHHTPEEGTIA